jgi:hypothetical protein
MFLAAFSSRGLPLGYWQFIPHLHSHFREQCNLEVGEFLLVKVKLLANGLSAAINLFVAAN